MYVVFKGTVPAGNKKFSTYEAARQQVRKWIRRQGALSRKWIRRPGTRAIDFFWPSNPMIGDFGYRIKKIA